MLFSVVYSGLITSRIGITRIKLRSILVYTMEWEQPNFVHWLKDSDWKCKCPKKTGRHDAENMTNKPIQNQCIIESYVE